MTIEIKFKKHDPKIGHVEGILRIKGGLLFFKFNQSDVAQQMIGKMQQGGAIITSGRTGKWMRVNLFGENEEVKMGGVIFNPKKKTQAELEAILTEFYQVSYVRAGFELETKKI